MAAVPRRGPRHAGSLRHESATGVGVVRLAAHGDCRCPAERGARGARPLERTSGLHVDHAERRRPARARRHAQPDPVPRIDLGVARRRLPRCHRPARPAVASPAPASSGSARTSIRTSSNAPPPSPPAPMSSCPSARRLSSTPRPACSTTRSATARSPWRSIPAPPTSHAWSICRSPRLRKTRSRCSTLASRWVEAAGSRFGGSGVRAVSLRSVRFAAV